MAKLKNANKDFNKVVDTIEAENYRELNDEFLIEEDGLVHDEPMLAGYVDKEGVLHNTFTFREMTGKDEEAISKADVRSNGARVVNVLVERCVEAIGTLTKKDLGAVAWNSLIRNLLGGDLDYMSMKIRELSKGKEINFEHQCPHCGAKLNSVVNTDEFKIEPFKGQTSIDFELVRGYKDRKGVHKNGSIRLANGLDRELVVPQFRKNSAVATSLLLTRLISFDDGTQPVQSFVSEMSLRDRGILEKIIEENAFGIDTKFEVTCSSCGETFEGEAVKSNFL